MIRKNTKKLQVYIFFCFLLFVYFSVELFFPHSLQIGISEEKFLTFFLLVCVDKLISGET